MMGALTKVQMGKTELGCPVLDFEFKVTTSHSLEMSFEPKPSRCSFCRDNCISVKKITQLCKSWMWVISLTVNLAVFVITDKINYVPTMCSADQRVDARLGGINISIVICLREILWSHQHLYWDHIPLSQPRHHVFLQKLESGQDGEGYGNYVLRKLVKEEWNTFRGNIIAIFNILKDWYFYYCCEENWVEVSESLNIEK